MNSINEILNDNERSVAVFTTHEKQHDGNLEIKDDGCGHTGNWALRKKPNIENVVIYHRCRSKFDVENKIYKAIITNIEGPLPGCSGMKQRYRIHFKNSKYFGTTKSTWSAFAGCGSNPVRYINT